MLFTDIFLHIFFQFQILFTVRIPNFINDLNQKPSKSKSIFQFQEGRETERLKSTLGGPRLRESYAAENPWAPTSKTPRLFYMSSTASAGQRFEAKLTQGF